MTPLGWHRILAAWTGGTVIGLEGAAGYSDLWIEVLPVDADRPTILHSVVCQDGDAPLFCVHRYRRRGQFEPWLHTGSGLDADAANLLATAK